MAMIPRKAFLTWQDQTFDTTIKYFSFSGGDKQVKFANIKDTAYQKSHNARSYISRSKRVNTNLIQNSGYLSNPIVALLLLKQVQTVAS